MKPWVSLFPERPLVKLAAPLAERVSVEGEADCRATRVESVRSSVATGRSTVSSVERSVQGVGPGFM
jgi:hypothetical protein